MNFFIINHGGSAEQGTQASIDSVFSEQNETGGMNCEYKLDIPGQSME